MGRVSYASRKTTGIKLGASIKKDLLKRTRGSNGRNAIKDTHVELLIPGRSLEDEGLQLVCEGLLQSIQSGGTILDELILSENALTAKSLEALTKIVMVAATTLKTLDVSKNNISVVTDEEVEHWHKFLVGLSAVQGIRKVNFSGNQFGHRAFEVFLRLYLKEPPLVLPSAEDSDDISDDDDDDDEAPEPEAPKEPRKPSMDKLTMKLQTLDLERRRVTKSLSESAIMGLSKAETAEVTNRHNSAVSKPPVVLRGLRSIAYINFADTALSDDGALHLTYIVPVHPVPKRLFPFLGPMKPADSQEILQTSLKCSGLIYLPNEKLGTFAKKALDLAESIRPGTLAYRGIIEADCMSPDSGRFNSNNALWMMDIPERFKSQTVELNKARHKIEGFVLKEYGAKHVQIWITAVRALQVARALLIRPKPGPKLVPSYKSKREPEVVQASPPQLPTPLASPAAVEPRIETPMTVTPITYARAAASVAVEQPFILSPLPPPPPPPTPTLLPQIDERTPMRHVTYFNNSPHTPVRSARRPSVGTENMATPANNVTSPLSSFVAPSYHSYMSENGIEGNTMVGNLPIKLWSKIIALSTDPDNYLSQRQLGNIIEWAFKRESLLIENNLAGKLVSTQVWRFLEGMECLTYEA